jgi:hypothetical protein
LPSEPNSRVTSKFGDHKTGVSPSRVAQRVRKNTWQPQVAAPDGDRQHTRGRRAVKTSENFRDPFRKAGEQAKNRRNVKRLGEDDPRKGFALISDSPVPGRLNRRIFLQLSTPTR